MARPPRARGELEALVVTVAGQHFALPAQVVREVLRTRPVTRVPHAPPSLLGLCNLRGAVLPVVPLARLLALPEGAPTSATRLVVLNGARPASLLVDAVAGFGAIGVARPLDPDDLLSRDFGGLRQLGLGRSALPSVEPRPEGAEQGAATEDLVLVGFRLSGQDYALPLDKVAAIARVPPEITALPRSGEAMRGVVAYRGGLLPLVAPHVLLGLTEPTTASAAARIVVTRFGAASVGLLVDRTTSIFRVPEAAIDPVPPVLALAAGDASVEAICRLDGGTRLLSVLAPARLFDAETTSRIMANAPREDASVTSDESQSEATEQFVVFRLGEEEYGLPIAAVEEVARRPESLSRVPRSPDYMEGLMNLRGAVVPVIDQSRRFGATTKAARSGGRIVVLTVGGLRAGFAVDEVREVLAVAAGEMAPAPDLAMAGAPLFDRVATLRRDGRMILLIDPQALLDAAERDILAALSAVASAKAPGRTGARTGAGAPAP